MPTRPPSAGSMSTGTPVAQMASLACMFVDESMGASIVTIFVTPRSSVMPYRPPRDVPTVFVLDVKQKLSMT